MAKESMAAFYREHQFNPVYIDVEKARIWESHRSKRHNLYERHLGIPLAFLRGRSVLSFGCNSGENELVFAAAGARVTLVEPNEQVHTRLRALFQQFGLEDQVNALVHAGVEDFAGDELYDLVLAEGFLFTLPNRDEMVIKLGRLVAPGGFAVITFMDRYGILIELTRRMILWRACQLAGVTDVFSSQCLDLARKLYGDDFARLNASRTFEAWVMDNFVAPFVVPKYLWTFPELVALVERAGCEVHSTSPRWALVDHFEWYKNCATTSDRHRRFLDDWHRMFPYFLTGWPPTRQDPGPASAQVIEATEQLVNVVGGFTLDSTASVDRIALPAVLHTYLTDGTGPQWQQLAVELKGLYEAAHGRTLESLLTAYLRSEALRRLWGTSYHYLCFKRPGP